jgi:hypothetical protein
MNPAGSAEALNKTAGAFSFILGDGDQGEQLSRPYCALRAT